MSETIINKVAGSGLITLNLETFLPEGDFVAFDLKDHLFMGLILKEKDFREGLKTLDWQQYQNKYVYISCTADAIIPVWAYMLVTTYLQPIAKDIFVGNEAEMKKVSFIKNISQINVEDYRDQRIVVKGCGDVQIDEFAYAEITKLLLPVVKSIMYGEPCSTVPIYKKK
jgi:hypothetical protein